MLPPSLSKAIAINLATVLLFDMLQGGRTCEFFCSQWPSRMLGAQVQPLTQVTSAGTDAVVARQTKRAKNCCGNTSHRQSRRHAGSCHNHS